LIARHPEHQGRTPPPAGFLFGRFRDPNVETQDLQKKGREIPPHTSPVPMVPVAMMPSPVPMVPVVAMPAPMAVVPVMMVPPAYLLRLKPIDFVFRDDGWVHQITRRRGNGLRGDRRQWCSLRIHRQRCRAGNQCNRKIQDLSAFHDVPPLLALQSWPMEEILQLRPECPLNPLCAKGITT
jgi:hypothetical protein